MTNEQFEILATQKLVTLPIEDLKAIALVMEMLDHVSFKGRVTFAEVLAAKLEHMKAQRTKN